MNKALLDTDILSDIGKGLNPVVNANAKTYRRSFGHYSFSTITVMEIVRGFQRVQSLQKLNAFVASLAAEEVLSFDEAAAELAGRILGDLERAGQPIGIALFAVGVLLALVAWSALLLQQRAIIERRPTSIKSELSEALRRLPSFFVATLLFLMVVGSGVAVIMVVPAQYRTGVRIPVEILDVYLAVLLSCTWPAVLFVGQGPLGALRQSARLVWGNWWRIAVVYVVGAAVVIVVSVLLGALIAAIVSSLGAGIPVMTSVFAEVANVLGAVTAPFVGALLLAAFADLRVRKEGTDLKQRIAGLAVD